jgi:hypothetical protein
MAEDTVAPEDESFGAWAERYYRLPMEDLRRRYVISVDDLRAAWMNRQKHVRSLAALVKERPAPLTDSEILESRNRWQVRAEEAQRLLEGLTIGGSEFVGSPARCASWIAEQLSVRLRAALRLYAQIARGKQLVLAYRRIAQEVGRESPELAVLADELMGGGPPSRVDSLVATMAAICACPDHAPAPMLRCPVTGCDLAARLLAELTPEEAAHG